MNCKILDGAKIASDIRMELKQKVAEFKATTGITPTLVTLTVGDNSASQIYVQKKIDACQEVGINASKISVPTDADLLKKQIYDLNIDDTVHAYILQLPLPIGLNASDFFTCFNPLKDVDVFHPENVGLLVQDKARFKPCTPHGIQVMLHRSGIKVAGKKIVVINRSNVVGRPLSSMLIHDCDEYANATVTVCHDRTPPSLLKEITLRSDIIIVAVGKPGFLTPDMVSPNAGVVDVGITRVGNKILGDVHPDVRNIAGWLTPVPGGCGLMTVTMLLENTLIAAKLQWNALQLR